MRVDVRDNAGKINFKLGEDVAGAERADGGRNMHAVGRSA